MSGEGEASVEELKQQLEAEVKYRKQLEKLLKSLGVDPSRCRLLNVDDVAKAMSEQSEKEEEEFVLPTDPMELLAIIQAPDWLEKLDRSIAALKALLQPPKGVEVRFQNLGYTVTMAAGAPRVPTVGQTLLGIAKLPLRLIEKPKTVNINVLEDLNGVLRPGQMTLLLGRPGSGKTTFMKALAFQLQQDKTHQLQGSVLLNGTRPGPNTFNPARVVSYTDQLDIHLPTLTVEETLAFSFRMQDEIKTRNKDDRRGSTTQKALKHLQTDLLKVHHILQMMGLDHVKDTLVGDELIRGISGGQKKRVTVAEALMGTQSVHLMDQISTGLDSSTTFDIIRCFRIGLKGFDSTTMIALLQPPPEVVELFDEIIVMDEGQIIYQGPRDTILSHFTNVGYSCPPRKDMADFLQEITAPESTHFFVAEGRVAPTNVKEFVDHYKESEQWKAQKAILDQEAPSPEFMRVQTKQYAHGLREMTRLLFSRQVKVLSRNAQQIGARVGQSVVMGLICGSLFYDLPKDQYVNRYGLFFLTAMMLALGGMSELPVVVSQRSVYYKQNDAGFYPAGIYALAQSFVGIPLNIVEVLVFGSILWWMCGLTDDSNGSRFGVFLIISTVLAISVNQLLRVVAMLSPSEQAATPMAGCCILFMILFSGFIVQEDSIPEYWIWMFWINPVAWAIRSYAILEFNAPEYDTEVAGGVREGDVYLNAYGFRRDDEWVWTCIFYQLGLYVACLFCSVAALKFVRYHGSFRSQLDDEKEQEEEMELREKRDHPPKEQEGEGEGDELRHQVRQHSARSPAQGVTSFTEVTLTFKNICYAVDLPSKPGQRPERLDLLNNISGYCKPGTLTALMGSSGAGKTTLLDVIAGRKTGGHISGDILLNGHPKEQATFARVSGYVEQMDLHSPNSTVEEALLFSARLRLPAEDIHKNARWAFVNEIISLLELESIRDSLIGNEKVGGLSSEQRKRVTIGVEMVANPSLLFLDEPTSGLDSRAAAIVMRAIKNVATTNRTVICTIHQPSTFLFEMFDNLLLLKKGGHTVYFGPLGEESSRLINYMESIPNAPKIKSGANPATYMLEVIGAGTAGNTSGLDLGEFYNHSEVRVKNDEDIAATTAKGEKVEFKTVYAAPISVQMKALVIKAFRGYWRSPNYNVMRTLLSAVIALVFGSVYKRSSMDSQADVVGRMSVMFTAAVFTCVIYMTSVLDTVVVERAVFYRERAANMYSTIPYSLSFALAEVPYLLGNTLLFSLLFYFTVGLDDDINKFMWFWLYFLLVVSLCTFTGQMVAVFAPDTETANVMATMVINLWVLFGGFLIVAGDIPDYWSFMYWLSPFHYTFEGMYVTQFRDETQQILQATPAGLIPVSIEQYVDIHFGGSFEYKHRHGDAFAVFVFILVVNFIRTLGLQYVKMIKR